MNKDNYSKHTPLLQIFVSLFICLANLSKKNKKNGNAGYRSRKNVTQIPAVVYGKFSSFW